MILNGGITPDTNITIITSGQSTSVARPNVSAETSTGGRRAIRTVVEVEVRAALHWAGEILVVLCWEGKVAIDDNHLRRPGARSEKLGSRTRITAYHSDILQLSL